MSVDACGTCCSLDPRFPRQGTLTTLVVAVNSAEHPEAGNAAYQLFRVLQEQGAEASLVLDPTISEFEHSLKKFCSRVNAGQSDGVRIGPWNGPPPSGQPPSCRPPRRPTNSPASSGRALPRRPAPPHGAARTAHAGGAHGPGRPPASTARAAALRTKTLLPRKPRHGCPLKLALRPRPAPGAGCSRRGPLLLLRVHRRGARSPSPAASPHCRRRRQQPTAAAPLPA